jgi:O-6-methylguanine DNA methyltransferase
MKDQLFQLTVSTRDGQFIARYSAKGLAELKFPSVGRASPRAVSRRRRGNESQISSTSKVPIRDSSRRLLPIPTQILRWHRATADGLKSSLTGRKPKNLPLLDLTGTEFQKRVWNALRKISKGRTKSYDEIAQQIGKPKAVRAVGGACGANPVPIFVPCHRVLATNKKLGGFSGGLDWKRKLLKREGVSVAS